MWANMSPSNYTCEMELMILTLQGSCKNEREYIKDTQHNCGPQRATITDNINSVSLHHCLWGDEMPILWSLDQCQAVAAFGEHQDFGYWNPLLTDVGGHLFCHVLYLIPGTWVLLWVAILYRPREKPVLRKSPRPLLLAVLALRTRCSQEVPHPLCKQALCEPSPKTPW